MATHVSTVGTPNATPPAIPAHNPGALIFAWVTGKPNTTAAVTLTNFTHIGTFTGGTGSQGSGTGLTYTQILAKIGDGTTTAPTLGGGAGGNTATMGYTVWEPDSGYTWRDAIADLTNVVLGLDDADTSEPYQATSAAFGSGWEPDGANGDAIFSIASFPDDNGTGITSVNHSATGLSGGTHTGRGYQETTSGNDCSHAAGSWTGFSGTPSTGITVTYDIFSLGVDHNGSGVVIAIRQTPETEDLTVAATMPLPTLAVSLTGFNDSDLSVAATMPLPTLAVSLTGFNDSDLSVAGTMPLPTLAVDIDVAPLDTQLTVAGTMPLPTLAVSLTGFNDSDLSVAGTMPLPVLAVDLEVDVVLRVTATMPLPTLAVSLNASTGATIGGTMPLPTLAVSLSVQGRLHTHTWNRAIGRVRTGRAHLAWDPPIAAPPRSASATFGTDRPMAKAFSSIAGAGNSVTYDVEKCYGPMLTYRLVVDGKDVTYFGGKRTPIPDYQFIEPFGYGPSVWTFETISAFDELGTGDLDWCDVDKLAKIQLVLHSPDHTRQVVSTVWRGRFDDFDDGPDNSLTVLASGLWSGDATMRDLQLPLFGSRQDVGRLVFHLAESIPGVRFTPRLGLVTDIEIQRFGGMRHLDAINYLLDRARTRNKGPFTIQPETWGTNKFEMVEKDTTTVHGTVYHDGKQTKATLHRQRAAEPDRIYGYGVTPGGQRVRNGRYPGLLDDPDETITVPDYPMTDGSTITVGMTNADTDTGDGISVMLVRLQTYGFLSRDDVEAGTFNAAAVEAVRRLQREAEMVITSGNMTPATWDVLFNVDRIGQSIWWSKVEPMAQKGFSKKWKLSGDGSILGKRDGWDPERRIVDKTNNYGVWTRAQMFDFAEQELDEVSDPCWIVEIEFGLGGLILGDHTIGDPITDDDFMDARDVRSGMNLKLPYSHGGELLVHISHVEVRGGSVPTVVARGSTRPLDTAPLWEILDATKEAKKNTSRLWWRQNRSSAKITDSVVEFEEIGGQINPVSVTGGEYKVFRVLAGQIGMIERFRLRTNPDREFVTAIFGLPITAAKLADVCPNPLADKQGWIDSMNELNSDHRLLYLAGEPGDPAGYSPGSKSAGHALTGELDDAAGFAYKTSEPDKFRPWVYVAFYAANDCEVHGGDEGRIMWNQELVGL